MSRKIHVNYVSICSMVVTVLLGALCAFLFSSGAEQFKALEDASNTYMTCESAVTDLQSASDYLTEQARLSAITGNKKYIDAYFEELDGMKRREKAVDTLKKYFGGTDAFATLNKALEGSDSLAQTEVYAMRLVVEANNIDLASCPERIRDTSIAQGDAGLSHQELTERAQQLLTNSLYQSGKSEIDAKVSSCASELVHQTRNAQTQAQNLFWDVYRKLGVAIAAFAVLMVVVCVIVRRLIIRPLIKYSASIVAGAEFPVTGAAELQHLAETYNRVFEQNVETQKLIRHQAEHDALTDLLNRGSFDRMLGVYLTEEDEHPFALILVDVDTFKHVNDTYGHAMGDKILKEVAELLRTTFRNIDHVCRIGGDEFAIIMVEMTPDLAYTITEKIDYINECLAKGTGDLPPVSLSVGVAFTQRPNPSPALFRDADKALYYTKEHGKDGITYYGDFPVDTVPEDFENE